MKLTACDRTPQVSRAFEKAGRDRRLLRLLARGDKVVWIVAVNEVNG